MKTNALNWFEIPVADWDRAVGFYRKVLQDDIQLMDTPGGKIGMLPYAIGEGVGGALSMAPGFKPSDQGSIVYLNCGDDLWPALERIEDTGGEVLLPKTPIGEYGFCAWFRDSEGNRVGLHSPK